MAAQSDQPLRSTAALPGAKCFVAAASADVLTDHPLVGLWQKVVGKAPQTGKTWAAVTILAAVITAAPSSTSWLVPCALAPITNGVMLRTP